jgi:hypothetical protein
MNTEKEMGPVKRFGDFAKEYNPLDGAKLKIDDILNKEILVTAIRLKPSKFNKIPDFLTIQFELNGERYVCFTGSLVLAEQAKKYEKELPFAATVKKIDKYYTFT